MLVTFLLFAGCRKTEQPAIKDEESCFKCECNILGEATLDEPRWKAYLENNLQPDSNQIDIAPTGTYTAIIQFEIETDGSIDNTMIIKDPGYDFGIWAMNIMKNYKALPLRPGFNVKSYRRQAIIWKVEE